MIVVASVGGMTVAIPLAILEVLRALARTTIKFLQNISKSNQESVCCDMAVMGHPSEKLSATDGVTLSFCT